MTGLARITDQRDPEQKAVQVCTGLKMTRRAEKKRLCCPRECKNAQTAEAQAKKKEKGHRICKVVNNNVDVSRVCTEQSNRETVVCDHLQMT